MPSQAPRQDLPDPLSGCITWQIDRLESSPPITQTNNRVLDEIAKLMSDAAGAAEGVRREVATIVRSQGERILSDMDVVNREEFEAVKAMAAKAREENDALAQRIAALEAELATLKAPR